MIGRSWVAANLTSGACHGCLLVWILVLSNEYLSARLGLAVLGPY